MVWLMLSFHILYWKISSFFSCLYLSKENIMFQDQPEEQFVRRKTQYSAETGRIIPPSSKSYQRKSHSQRLKYPQPLHDQELTVKILLHWSGLGLDLKYATADACYSKAEAVCGRSKGRGPKSQTLSGALAALGRRFWFNCFVAAE